MKLRLTCGSIRRGSLLMVRRVEERGSRLATVAEDTVASVHTVSRGWAATAARVRRTARPFLPPRDQVIAAETRIRVLGC
jgi:hypothetical protein